MAFDISKLRVAPGKKPDLKNFDTRETVQWDGDRDEAEERTAKLNGVIEHLQEVLYAQDKHRVLIVLQAMDAGGKDGTIRAVLDGVNPQGVKVASFKKPSSLEMSSRLPVAHPLPAPGQGEIVVFNRSHYEDVLVVRVWDSVPKIVWKKRYGHIGTSNKCWPTKAPPSSRSCCTSPRRSRRSVSSLGWMSRTRTGNSTAAIWPSARSGTTTWRRSRMPWRRPAPKTLRGMSFPATASGTATLPSARSLAQTLESLDLEYPPAEDDILGTVIPD